ncbi:hypothetical protein [Mesorhizobium sp. YM1C-6-2]|jgi:hypothetical protein|uniref:hypothetical protein n=1 Tax=Mesorhizobium sp. YM1C-6-2 TaxID=1827501 RepID=UPI0011C42DEE|nr:hypothetical protein [Mesorhizobium sp. YM1C-6-2]
MKTPKNRSMPLTAAMARFVDVAELIRSRAELDDTLRDLCEDYRLARELLLNAKKEKPRSTKNISEYSSLVDDLEDEIMRYLVNVKQHPET